MHIIRWNDVTHCLRWCICCDRGSKKWKWFRGQFRISAFSRWWRMLDGFSRKGRRSDLVFGVGVADRAATPFSPHNTWSSDTITTPRVLTLLYLITPKQICCSTKITRLSCVKEADIELSFCCVGTVLRICSSLFCG